ncbi:hypothetical protein J32TS2_10810 [Shouchella clausii]|nr:hypothetical protein J32TS2_10810 [Shouchella clausii]
MCLLRVNGYPQIINKYKKWYIGQYGDPKINWDQLYYSPHHSFKVWWDEYKEQPFHLPRDFY